MISFVLEVNTQTVLHARNLC